MNQLQAFGAEIRADIAAIIRHVPPPLPPTVPLDGAGHFATPYVPPHRRLDETAPPATPKGLPVQGRVSGVFGAPLKNHTHKGEDFAAPTGSVVIATADGDCVGAEVHQGYGNLVAIAHGRRVVTRYAHLSVMLVRPGEHVTRGQVIGLVGSTGHSTGPHLHYEVLVDNHFTDPKAYL